MPMHPKNSCLIRLVAAALLGIIILAPRWAQSTHPSNIGREVAVPRHLEDEEEFMLPIRKLIEHGQELFAANWTAQEGAGRPLTKGTGAPLSDQTEPLIFPRNFNRVSGPDSNSCAGCHNSPFGIPGGEGDIVANVFVLGQRFDFATFDPSDPAPTKSSVNEMSQNITPQDIANSRATVGMFGSGFIEMLARQTPREHLDKTGAEHADSGA